MGGRGPIAHAPSGQQIASPYKKATRKSFYWYCVMQRKEQGFC